MTDVTIDNSKLPGVKEVCRDFAVLEDHSLAHSLQEQEIEHHLATNLKRNRLAKHDLKVAKQLQEEEEIKAQAQIKHHQDQFKLLDGEIAQEIQEKLVIEAELKRLQEEKDEDIARVLQEREEKRRKKHYPPQQGPEEPNYPDREGHHSGRRKEYISDRPHRHERPERNRKERGAPRSERASCNDDDRKRGRSAEPRSVPRDNAQKHESHINKTSAKRDRPERPPQPRTSKHEDHDNENANQMNPIEDLPRRVRSQSHDLSIKHSGNKEYQDSSYSKPHKKGTGGDHEYDRHRRRTPSPQDERQYKESGHRAKGHRESPHARPRDAEIARRLQEEEMRVNTDDYRTAQLAQDEELARWLMEKEQQSYKKSKGREKLLDRKRPDERELNSREHGRPHSRDEQHCSQSDKPYRPLPPAPDEDHSDDSHDYTNRNPHSSPRSGSKSQSSHKGSYYRQ